MLFIEISERLTAPLPEEFIIAVLVGGLLQMLQSVFLLSVALVAARAGFSQAESVDRLIWHLSLDEGVSTQSRSIGMHARSID